MKGFSANKNRNWVLGYEGEPRPVQRSSWWLNIILWPISAIRWLYGKL